MWESGLRSDTKFALVTGSGQRIGAAIAKELHACGFCVAIHYRHSQDEALRLTQELNARRTDSTVAFQADLQDLDQVIELGSRVIEEFGRLDVLVNNASEFIPNAIPSTSADTFGALFGIHVKAPFFLMQSVMSELRAAQGCIVNITDIYAGRPLTDYSLYCASKAALEALTRSLALELAPDIRVNAVAPGAILWAEGEQASADVITHTPLGRIGNVDEIATAVKYLVLNATFTSGQTLVVDGGRMIATP